MVNGEKNIDRIISLLENFLIGFFVAENISDFEDFFEFDSFLRSKVMNLSWLVSLSKMPPPYQRSKQKLISKSLSPTRLTLTL